MPTINYSFTTASNYTFDPLKIEVVGGVAKLLLNVTYPTDNPKIEPNASFSQDALVSFLTTVIVAGSDLVKYTIKVGGQERYWTGAVWANSDGTYAQTNTLAEIQANIAAFGSNGTVTPVIYLHSDDGSTTPSIDSMDISYNSFGAAATSENLCNVWGYLYNELGNPVASASIVVTPVNQGLTSDKIINKDPTTISTDANGYWEISLVETATDGNNWSYAFLIAGVTYTKFIPNSIDANFNTLVNT